MNWRVRFLALVVLFFFGAFGSFTTNFVKKRSHGIILLSSRTRFNHAQSRRQQSEWLQSSKVDIWMQPLASSPIQNTFSISKDCPHRDPELQGWVNRLR